MNILSLYDGMACGHIAMTLEDIPIDRYVAYEIDGYAVKTAVHNFPDIEQRGDVFDGDFTEFEGFDWLIGGSPCTYWSIAQKNNRETEASGLGWELFCQYTRALREAKPKFFIYENNKSMSKAIRESITEAFGFEPICINSALVSAQNRQRLYWVGRRNDDGTYSKVDVPMPEDRGILLKDILEGGELVTKDKAYCLKHQAGNARDYFKKHHTDVKFERVPEYGICGKARPISASYAHKGSGEGSLACDASPDNPNKQVFDYVAEPVNVTLDGKAKTLIAGYRKQGIENCCGFVGFGSSGVAEPIYIGAVPENNGTYLNGKQPSQQYRVYDRDGKGVAVTTAAITNVAEPVRVGCMPSPDGEIRNSQAFRVYDVEGKSVNLTSGGAGAGGKTGLYAIQVDNQEPRCYATPCEWDEDGKPIKAVSCADGKVYIVYEVKDGKITIKGKEYPIKLVDGFYIIRKLTVRECMRLQTVPEWYEFPVSDTQAYKMLGNGWTVEVIRHLIRCAVKDGEKND